MHSMKYLAVLELVHMFGGREKCMEKNPPVLTAYLASTVHKPFNGFCHLKIRLFWLC